jgi:hypothetical protein
MEMHFLISFGDFVAWIRSALADIVFISKKAMFWQ